MITDLSRGVVYVAWGRQFVAEAVTSAAHVRRVMTIPIVLVTNEAIEDETAFDEVICVPFAATYRDKILMRLSPFARTIFLDTDTTVIEPLDQIFEMLSRFDLVYQTSGPSSHYDLPGVPMLAFEEPSAGLIAWRRNDAVDQFFSIWAADYDAQERANGNGAWDQRSMRSALWQSEIDIYGLGQDWQLYSFEAGVVMNKVRMVHGRGRPASAAIVECNRVIGPRAYVPGIGFFPVWNATPSDCFSLSARAAFLGAKRSLRLLLAKSGLWKLPANKRPM